MTAPIPTHEEGSPSASAAELDELAEAYLAGGLSPNSAIALEGTEERSRSSSNAEAWPVATDWLRESDSSRPSRAT